MTEKTDKIVDALKGLDTTNDAHWTTDGLPRLETVKFLAKDQSLTRDDVTNAASGFTRTNTEIKGPDAEGKIEVATPSKDANDQTAADKAGDTVPVAPAAPAAPEAPAAAGANAGVDIPGARDIEPSGELTGRDAEGDLSGRTDTEAVQLGERTIGEQPETGDLSITAEDEPTVPGKELPTERTPANAQDPSFHPAPATEGHVGPREGDFPASEATQAEQDQVESFLGDDTDEVATLQEDLEEAEARISDLNRVRDEVAAELDKANAEADRIRDSITTARGSSDNTNVILTALESRKRQAEAQGQVKAAIAAAGIDVQALVKATSKAPIDQAMARKTGFGGRRPQTIR